MSNDAMEIKIRAVVDGMDAAKAQINDLLSEAEKTPQRVQNIGTAADTMGSKLETAFGGSSRAVNQFGNAIAAVVPIPGQLSYAIDLLMDSGVKAALSFTAMTGGVMALGLAYQKLTEYVDQATEAEKRRSALKFMSANDAYAESLKKQIEDAKKVRDEIAQQMGKEASPFSWESASSLLPEQIGGHNARLAEQRAKLDEASKAVKEYEDKLARLPKYSSDAANTTVTFRDELLDLETGLYAASAAMDVYTGKMPLSIANIMALAKNSRELNAGGGPTFEDMSLVDPTAWKAANDAYLTDQKIKGMAANQQLADDWARKMKAQAEAFYASLVGKAEGMLQVSQVTAQDLADTAAGKYKDKNDENIRRLKLYPEIDSAIFQKLPQQIQQELKAAMESGGAGAYRLKITDLIQAGESFGDSRLWDVDKMANDLRAQVEAENNKKRLAEEVVARSGLDKNNATVMAQANKLSGADPTGINGIVDSAKKTIEDFRPANSLANAFQADKDNIIKAGKKMGEFVVSGLRDQIVDAVDDISTSFMKSLTGSLDGRYVRQARTFGGLQ